IETLATVRACRKTPVQLRGDLPVRASAAAAPVRLREALFSDFGDVEELQRRCGLAPDSRENWARFWRRTPALGQMQFELPLGWVLEAEGNAVGYLGNISLLYRYGERSLTAVAGRGLAGDPTSRAASFCLGEAFH